MEYKIVIGEGILDTQNKINELLKQGYNCLGGVQLGSMDHGQPTFFQAMIKSENKTLLTD